LNAQRRLTSVSDKSAGPVRLGAAAIAFETPRASAGSVAVTSTAVYFATFDARRHVMWGNDYVIKRRPSDKRHVAFVG
jgi:hypothetical protein